MAYSVDFQSGGVETSPSISGKATINLSASAVDTVSTTLTLTGKGVPNYGEIQQENFIRLLENFASKNAPSHPTIGQIWFDSVASALKVYAMDSVWHTVGGTSASNTPPSVVQPGDLWYDLANLTLKVWDGSMWIAVNGGIPKGTSPTNPIKGELWFDTVNNILKVWDGSAWVAVGSGGVATTLTPPPGAAEGTLWYNPNDKILYVKQVVGTADPDHPLYYTDWAQVWPDAVRIAGWQEYNALAARINKIIGAPQVSGSDSDVANNQWGWGQTDLLEIFTSYNSPSAFDNTKWIILLSRLRKALRHSNISENVCPTIGLIQDGRGPSALATQYTPSVTWKSGFQGLGITPPLGITFAGEVILSASSTLTMAQVSGRLVVGASATATTQILPLAGSGWYGSIISFFNSGGGTMTVQIQAPDNVFEGIGGGGTAITLKTGETLYVSTNGNGQWRIIGGTITSTTSPALTGNPTAPTPPQFDNDTSIATTAFVKGAMGSFSSRYNATTSQTLPGSMAGYVINMGTAVGAVVTLPLVNSIPAGSVFCFENGGSSNTVAIQGGDLIYTGASNIPSLPLAPGETLWVESNGVSLWHVVGGTAAITYSSRLAGSASIQGYQKMPNGTIMQWGDTATGAGGVTTTLFPIPFPNACASVTVTEASVNVWSPTNVTIFGTDNQTTTSFVTRSYTWNGSSFAVNPAHFKWVAFGY